MVRIGDPCTTCGRPLHEVLGDLRYDRAEGSGPPERRPGHWLGRAILGLWPRLEGSYAVGRIRLTIHHLYADMMNLYGDRGNVIAIKKRAEWRGIPVEVVDVGLEETIKPTPSADLFLFGGGQDREQALLAEDLSGCLLYTSPSPRD